ncbi:hypothetical protein AB205_0099290 [Aquarana catesbeiana]|uniref:Uncharacterized protein n=1 Tax=Aquarana catesbeiana TaxID=8400 RepID=A0A2G9SLM5_AQUCT|nr:hypothetical protein AB205_0099290 [Aquarana catesbeiana]
MQKDQRGAMSAIGRGLAERRKSGIGKGGIEKRKSQLATNHQEAAGAAMTVKKATVTEDTSTKNPNEARKERMREVSLPLNPKVLRHLLISFPKLISCVGISTSFTCLIYDPGARMHC